jgi:hypothetical protein
VLRHNKDYPQAEQILREMVNNQPQNGAARENLYYVLKEQNKTDDAQAILRTLPASLQAKLQPRVVTGLPGILYVVRHNRLSIAGIRNRRSRFCVRALPVCRTIRGCVLIWRVCCKNRVRMVKRRR